MNFKIIFIIIFYLIPDSNEIINTRNDELINDLIYMKYFKYFNETDITLSCKRVIDYMTNNYNKDWILKSYTNII